MLPLLWRRRAPVRALLAVLVTQSLYGVAVDGPGQTLPYTGLLALYSVAAYAPAPSRQRLGVLTARERETLLHLARGLSNAEIAAAMVVSDHTVKTHVGNVLSKLGLRDRIQAVICAYETGLVAPSPEGAPPSPSPVQGRRGPAGNPPLR